MTEGKNRQWILNARPASKMTGEEFRWNEGRWQGEGRLVQKEDIAVGLENAPRALLRPRQVPIAGTGSPVPMKSGASWTRT